MFRLAPTVPTTFGRTGMGHQDRFGQGNAPIARYGRQFHSPYNGIPPKWVTYIYKTYGITTMINHTVGRYGMDIDGVWVPVTNYADPRTREILKQQVKDVILEYKDVEGVLLWLWEMKTTTDCTGRVWK